MCFCQRPHHPEQLYFCAVPTFNAKQHIMAAFATWDSDRRRGVGFVTQGRDQVLQSVGALVGVSAPKDASGTHRTATHNAVEYRYIPHFATVVCITFLCLLCIRIAIVTFSGLRFLKKLPGMYGISGGATASSRPRSACLGCFRCTCVSVGGPWCPHVCWLPR